jgi:16S rRNA (adenine1518-N6/adenine1519-N6)-dimethyltransferase
MRQKFGQNFLIDNNTAVNIVKAASLREDDFVLEIGAGKGILTREIARLVKNLVIVEIDKELYDRLKTLFAQMPNLDCKIALINADFLKLRWEEFVSQNFPQNTDIKIISNLPYSAGTAIIQSILPQHNWSDAVFMLQKEVAHRLCAQSGSREYGYISTFCSHYTQRQILFDVSPRCFYPQPKVVSSVIKLINKKSQAPDELLFPLIKHCFSMRRKTILNCLTNFKGLQKNVAAEILQEVQIDMKLRPEKLTPSDFAAIVKTYKEYPAKIK